MTTPPSLDPVPDDYTAAVGELEQILREIEDAEVDVDVLATRVVRAAALIDWCRTRILAAQDAVDEATAHLDPEPNAGTVADEGATADA